ncbi:MAG: acyltransferase, partial [Ilumatobacteraceae bacterium]
MTVPTAAAFRQDIEGLRGVAVTVVVLFHVGLRSVTGGYIGVDVFFVISGYLISAQLIREVESHGRVRFLEFWARRFRRLMPLLLVTLVATLAAGLIVYSPLFWQQLAQEGTASALYVSNIHFAQRSSFYFQSGTSPLLHTWSLSVEEQFYVLWPLIVAGVGGCARRCGQAFRRTLVWAIAAASACSFVVALLLVRRGSPWAFFSGPSRAWEFGLGALSFLSVGWFGRVGRMVRQFVVAIGLAAIVAAAVLFDEFTNTPGVATIVPVLGTALILVADAGADRGVGRLLSAAPLRALGRVSYGWYLFHWPAIVLVAAAMQRSSVTAAAVAALASLVLAWLATRVIESPVRGAAQLRRPRRVVVATGGACLAIVAAGQLTEAVAHRRMADPPLAALLEAR